MKKLSIIFVLIISLGLLTACKKDENKPDSVNTAKELIKDCPDEKIINKMPQIVDDSGENTTAPQDSNEYYIYKGERKEISDFDQTYVDENCEVKETEVF